MSTKSEQFHLEEFKLLRTEVLETIKEIPSIERLSLLMTGAIWAWIFTNTEHIDKSMSVYFAFIPFVISTLFLLRVSALKAKIKTLGGYLKKLESEYGKENLGWEAYLESRGSEIFSRFTVVFWGIQITGNFMLGIFLIK